MSAPGRAFGPLQNRTFAFRVVALSIVFVAFVIRMNRLTAMGLEFDEAFSVQAALMDWRSLLALLATSEPHPPFFYFFLKAWIPIAGTSEFALRFVSVFANVLTIAFLVAIAEWFGWRIPGLVAAVLFALNPYQVWYSQEVRMYAVVALFGASAAYFALRALRNGRTRDLVLYVGSMILCLATHYYALFFFTFISLAILLKTMFATDGSRFRKRWLIAQGAVAAVLAPWLVFASQVGLHYIRDVPNFQAELTILQNSLLMYSLGSSVPTFPGSQLSVYFLGIMVVGLAALSRTRAKEPVWFGALFVVGYLFVPVFGGFLVSLFRALFAVNYLMVSAPAFFLLLGIGVVALGRVAWPLGAISGLFLVAFQLYSLRNYFVDPLYNKAELADAIHFVQNHQQPGDGTVLDGLGQTTQFWYYHDLRANDPTPSYVFPLLGHDATQRTGSALDGIMSRQRGAWLLDYGVREWDPARQVEAYLAKNYYRAFYHVIYHNRVVYFASPPASAPTVTPLDLSCNGEVALKDVSTFSRVARAGDVLPIAVRWQALGPARKDYVVSWRLVDAADHPVMQFDSEPADGLSPTSSLRENEVVVDHVGFVLPSNLPPGLYSVGMVIYQKTTGAICQWDRGETVLPSPTITAASVTIDDRLPAPALAESTPTHLAHVNVGGLTFLGYDLAPGARQPGDLVSIRLFWHVDERVSANFDVTTQIQAAGGAILQEARTPLGSTSFPTSRWQAGRTVATYVDVAIPARATTDLYHLSLTVHAAGLDQSLLVDSPTIPVTARTRTFRIPSIANPRVEDFGNLLDLLGFNVMPAANRLLTRNEPLTLTLYWKDLRTVNRSYKVFAHLVGPDGKIYGQADAIPLNGSAPTTSWLPGEVLTDRYQLTLDPSAPPATYDLEVGLYDPETGARIPLTTESADKVDLTSVKLAS